jgi:catechol 2,3-dioxygenase-like lactoylglutathione lyase family enzyme
MKLFKHLMHVTMFANDIDKSIEYYGKLGFEVLFDNKMQPDAKPWNYYLRVANGEYIELQALDMIAPSPHPSPKKVYAHPDRSMWHFALETDNLRETIQELWKKGITVWKDPEKSGVVEDYERDVHHGEDGCEIAWLIDPDDNPIEIMQQIGETLQKKLKTEIKHFSYPRGIITEYARELVRTLYKTGVTIFDGNGLIPDDRNLDLSALKRLPVQRSDGRHLFHARIKDWLIGEEWLKKLIGRY